MKPAWMLRIASVLTLIHCLLHTVGGVLSPPRHGEKEVAVIETMKSYQFDMFGSMRTYWDFFFGYGLFVTISLLVLGVFFWQLANMSKTNALFVRRISALFTLNFILMAIVSWRYFFLGPAITELLIAACLVGVFATSTAPSEGR